MTYFTTRVELHDAVYADYVTLHAAMAAEGFSRTVTAEGGTKYHLQTAEYLKTGDLQRTDVLDSAKRAGAKTGKKYSVCVTVGTSMTWHNLEVVK